MGGDSRTYIKMSDSLPEHRKIAAVGGDAAWLHVCALAYASRNLTDGAIPEGVVPRLSDRRQPARLAAKLTEVGLWHAAGHDCKRCPQPQRGEYVIHDYLAHQRSAAKVDEIRHKRADAGRAGGNGKAANAKQTASNLLDGCNDAAVANGTPVSEEVLRTSQSVSETDLDLPPSAAHESKQTSSNLLDVDGPRHRLPPDQVAERQRHVGEVVAAFAEGATDAGLRNPPASLRSRVGKQAKALLAEDWPIDFLIESARRMGAGEFDDLARQVRKDDAAAKGRSGQNGAGPNAGKSTGAERAQEPLAAGQRVQQLIDEGKLQL